MENKDPIKIEPCEFVAPVDDAYNPLTQQWEGDRRIITRSEAVAILAALLVVLILGVIIWI